VYNFVIKPALEAADVEPYRSDLDLTPGPVTPKMLSELLEARLVIADLTGRNPNVYYELGLCHAFARPVICLIDSHTSLPFDAKDERTIEIGESAEGLTYAEGETAKNALSSTLKVVLAEGYTPSSPISEYAAARSVDQLAPENPVASELAAMRESLEEIRSRTRTFSHEGSAVQALRNDLAHLRRSVAEWVAEGTLSIDELDRTVNDTTSVEHDDWVRQTKLVRRGG
jgi:hypothetical protein